MPEAPHGGRSPGWREVLLVAIVVLGAVLGLELLSAALLPVRDLFGGLPIVIVVLVAGTAAMLLLVMARRPRG